MWTFLRELFEKQFGKITPAKIVVALVILILLVRVLGFVVSLFDAILPFMVLGVIGYFAYQMLETRAPGWRDKVKETVTSATQRDAAAEDAIEKVKRDLAATTRRIDAEVATASEAISTPAQAASAAPAPAEETTAEAPARLLVEQKVNPQTGLEEPDMARLEAKEQEMLNEPKTVNDSVRAQLEARKKRLKGEE